jgi:hypothetical protein
MRVGLKTILLWGAALPAIVLLAGCGGGGGGAVNSTPTPLPIAPSPPPPPTLPPANTGFNTAEYRASNGAVQAQAIAAYDAGAS